MRAHPSVAKLSCYCVASHDPFARVEIHSVVVRDLDLKSSSFKIHLFVRVVAVYREKQKKSGNKPTPCFMTISMHFQVFLYLVQYVVFCFTNISSRMRSCGWSP